MPALVVGIDVAFAKRKLLPIVVAHDVDGRVVPLPRGDLPRRPPVGGGNRVLAVDAPIGGVGPAVRFAHETAYFLADAAEALGLAIARIAIDAPRTESPPAALRASEQAMADAGLSFIRTPPDLDRIRGAARAAVAAGRADNRLAEANRLWMIVGVELFQVLGERFGHECLIEVYPYAAFERLGVTGRKNTAAGVSERLAGLAPYAGWDSIDELRHAILEATWGPMHDKLDAYLCAVLASRAEARDSFQGDEPDPFDRIWMPPP
jgi:hypothetical protein